MNKQDWFASWFDSPYYPILYQHRDHREAEAFIKELLDFLNPGPGAHFLDLACGRGRHSLYIHRQSFKVTGLDLSPQSIEFALKHKRPGLDFKVHDMRDPLPGSYDHILNLFTSFGYFDDQQDNLRVLRNVRNALRPGGTFVLDFMNVEKIIPGLIPFEKKELDGVHFTLQRSIENGYIVKDIHVDDAEHIYHFQERVQALDRTVFQALFKEAGLEVTGIWGNYGGGDFSPAFSPRLIYFCS